jgi:predicted metalloprotease with PDZ domain
MRRDDDQASPAHAQAAPPTQGAAACAVHYVVEAHDPHAHLYRVRMRLQAPQASQLFQLPAWIPGSYLLREFTKHLQRMRAVQAGRVVALVQLDKSTWRADCAGASALDLEYEVYAADPSVRSSWLDGARGFFNGTSLFLRAAGHEHLPHGLEIQPPPGPLDWRVATALRAADVDERGFGRYLAPDYDTLVDSPVEMGPFWSASFEAGGIAHQMVVSGAAPSFDGERLVQDARKICAAAVAFWHGQEPPAFDRFVFLLNALEDGHGGLEHGNSTALVAARRDLPRRNDGTGGAWRPGDGYTTVLGLISHEYFHAWNVKRLRPAEFERYDYAAENYTRLLWFFEGFTSYYDDLLLVRAGLLDHAGYLKLLTKTVNQVLQTPGRLVQTLAEASFDAWVKFYRQDENTPNATVSYYSKGALVALCLDLTLRREGRSTLDAVMRALWVRCKAGPMQESDLLATLEALGGRSYAADIAAWVHSNAELPLAELLAAHGVRLHADTPQWAQRLGLRLGAGPGVRLKAVLRGGLAESAGLAAGDEWLGIETPEGAWRMQQLDDLALFAPSGACEVVALVARDQRLLRLPIALAHARPTPMDTVQLLLADAALAARWLDGR